MLSHLPGVTQLANELGFTPLRIQIYSRVLRSYTT